MMTILLSYMKKIFNTYFKKCYQNVQAEFGDFKAWWTEVVHERISAENKK